MDLPVPVPLIFRVIPRIFLRCCYKCRVCRNECRANNRIWATLGHWNK